MLCGMAATMYYMQDEAAGTFAHVKQRWKGVTAFGCVLTAVLNLSVVLTVSLWLSSLAGNLFREAAIVLLYAVCCTSFGLLLRRICASLRAYAALIPLLTVVGIGVCPVFFDFKKFNI